MHFLSVLMPPAVDWHYSVFTSDYLFLTPSVTSLTSIFHFPTDLSMKYLLHRPEANARVTRSNTHLISIWNKLNDINKEKSTINYRTALKVPSTWSRKTELALSTFKSICAACLSLPAPQTYFWKLHVNTSVCRPLEYCAGRAWFLRSVTCGVTKR